jgi:hypothetical protein
VAPRNAERNLHSFSPLVFLMGPALLKQQSRRRSPTPDGFAFVPIRAVFLNGIRWAVELA